MWLKNGRYYDMHLGELVAADLRIDAGRIAEIGTAPSGAAGTDMSDAILLPGFIDCHVHLCVDTYNPDPNNVWRGSLPGTVALFAAEAARRTLMCGITTARDVGGWDYHEIAVREAIEAGTIPGPRLFCAGRILTMTSSTTPYFRGMYEEADGPAEVRKAARKQLAMGADLVKIMASGALTSTKYERADAIQYRPDEIRAAVEIAADNDTHVAAHAHASDAIKNAVECGCRSVEHGTYGNDALHRLMAEKGTFLVPTVCVTPAMLADPGVSNGLTTHIRERYIECHDIAIANLRAAHGAGVEIAMGTDAGTPGNHAGDNMQEVEIMATEAGLSPAEAIRTSTWNPARLLGREGDFGSIEVGKLADIIAVPRNPLEDISAIREVFFVMKEGRVYRQDRR